MCNEGSVVCCAVGDSRTNTTKRRKRIPRTRTPKTTNCPRRIRLLPATSGGCRCSASMHSKKNPSLWTRKESLTGHWWEPSTWIFDLWRGTWIPMGTLWSKRRRQRFDSSNAYGKVRHDPKSKNPPTCSHFNSFDSCCVEHPLYLQ
jgi:hypothetical protein